METASRPFGFGCERCYGDDAEAAHAHRLAPVRELIDDSHFGVSLRRCPACHQAFVHVFTEFVDWVDGDDPQYTDLVPVSDAEAEALAAEGEGVDRRAIETLCATRRRLSMTFPKGGPRRVFWAGGGPS